MLRRREVIVGKCYANNARKVTREVVAANHETVKFHTYHLDTGNSCSSPSECAKQEFMHWADREVTPAEMASLQTQEMDALFRTTSQASSWKALDHTREIDPAALMVIQKNGLNR